MKRKLFQYYGMFMLIPVLIQVNQIWILTSYLTQADWKDGGRSRMTVHHAKNDVKIHNVELKQIGCHGDMKQELWY